MFRFKTVILMLVGISLANPISTTKAMEETKERSAKALRVKFANGTDGPFGDLIETPKIVLSPAVPDRPTDGIPTVGGGARPEGEVATITVKLDAPCNSEFVFAFDDAPKSKGLVGYFTQREASGRCHVQVSFTINPLFFPWERSGGKATWDVRIAQFNDLHFTADVGTFTIGSGQGVYFKKLDVEVVSTMRVR